MYKTYASYTQRVREIEHGSFTSSTTGGVGAAAKVCYKRLASLLSVKWNMPYSCTLTWIRCKLSFSLIRSSIQCIRGSRSSPHTPMHPCHLAAFYMSQGSLLPVTELTPLEPYPIFIPAHCVCLIINNYYYWVPPPQKKLYTQNNNRNTVCIHALAHNIMLSKQIHRHDNNK